jgi:ribonucleotide reductase beta subunit family protein with ferritin-like domain
MPQTPDHVLSTAGITDITVITAEAPPVADGEALDPGKFLRWSVISRDERFRAFNPDRIARAIGKALAAVDGDTAPSAARTAQAAALTARICGDLTGRRPNGGSFYLEEIQDLAELALMRAGEFDAARRFVLYRDQRRRARQADTDGTVIDPSIAPLVARLADPLVTASPERFVMFPIRHDDLWRAFKDHLALVWTAEEIDLAKDQQDWKRLSGDERHFLTHVLAFFAASDGIVNENLAARFYREVMAPEARAYYSMQMLIESIHSETYALLIESYIGDEAEKRKVFAAIETMPIVGRKARWALDWLGSERPLGERLVAFACIEGIFFSSSFCSIYWLKNARPGMLPGLCFSNELISRDEGLHTDFAILLHSHLQDKARPERIRQLVAEAVAIECDFATTALPVSLIGMNAAAMQDYIRFVADRLMVQLGQEKLYGAPCPFDFMERMSLQNKTNFHEKKVAEYRKAGVGHDLADQAIAFDAEF